jgi:pimeloyl-ACP methyl ester carboxylesterase
MLEQITEVNSSAGIRERHFDIARPSGRVPGVLWTPAQAKDNIPLILLGHGGSGHKRDESRLERAYAFVQQHGIAAAAIDGPFHGERTARSGLHHYDEAIAEQMVGDWTSTLDALLDLNEFDHSRVGYGGVSMGTMFGLPFIVTDGRIRSSVLGLCGLQSATTTAASLFARLARDAPRLTCPTLFLMQWDDELFSRDSVLSLFDLIGAEDKRLYANPGGHAETPEHVRDTSREFLVAKLLA